MNKKLDSELPLGLGMALAQSSGAMQAFSEMSDEDRGAIIEKAHAVSSKKEMTELISAIGKSPL